MKIMSFFIMSLFLVSCAHKGSYAIPEINAEAEAIRDVLRSNTPKFRSCYRSEVDTSSSPQNLEGTINLKFTVGENGKVSKSEIQSKDIKDGLTTKCIKAILDDLNFPKSTNGNSYDVSQPINLRPAPAGQII